MSVAVSTGSEQLEAECRRLAEALSLSERDRQLVGYEIHDGLVQDLTAAALLLEGSERQATFATGDAQASFAKGLQLLRDSISAARQMVRGATSLDVDGGDFVAALSRLVGKFRTEHGLPITFSGAAEHLRLPASVRYLLLRIAQEALFNAWKHSQAGQVTVRLTRHNDTLDLLIADDGVGFDPLQVPAGHFGLDGIRARAGILGAKLNVTSNPGQGTQVSVQVSTSPLD